jgi:hypothetical protein
MTTIWGSGRSPYGMACRQCRDSLIAPTASGYISKHEVVHLWFCENCGHKSKTVVNPRLDIASKSGKSGTAASVSMA